MLFPALLLSVTLGACGGYEGTSARLPSAPSDPGTGGSDAPIVMESSQGLAPAGFRMVSHVDPKAGEDGVIRAESPVTVTFDLCDSTVDDGGHPWFLFDFDFNHAPDVIGKVESCRQTHTYRIPLDAPRDLTLGANFCFTNADPSKGGKGTYFSCRSVQIALPHFPGAARGCYPIEGGSFVWPGGVGPQDVEFFEDKTCTGPDSNTFGPVAAARNEGDAKRLCGNPEVLEISRFGTGSLFFCSPGTL
jgi:hypothetical protein